MKVTILIEVTAEIQLKWPIEDEELGSANIGTLTTQQSLNGSEEWYCSLLRKKYYLMNWNYYKVEHTI